MYFSPHPIHLIINPSESIAAGKVDKSIVYRESDDEVDAMTVVLRFS